MLSYVCSEGPCLIHSMNGDLLRTLEGPERCLRPRLIQSSTEGHCVIYYDKGQFCRFSVNGKLLGHMEMEDSIKVMKFNICVSMHANVHLHMCVCTTSVYNVLLLIKGFLTVVDLRKVKGLPASGQTAASHLFLFPFTRIHQRKWSF